MKEKPIILSAPEVQAILDGRKTQTRRALKPQPPEFSSMRMYGEKPTCFYCCDGEQTAIKMPYQLGDILWVRETWGYDPTAKESFYYKAEEIQNVDFNEEYWKWRPSIHMPRAAARIFLRVTDVRVERLQEINELDAIAEGIMERIIPDITLEGKARLEQNGGHVYEYHDGSGTTYNAADAYRRLWDSINAKRGYGWDVNPWVWVYEFERMI